VTKVAEYEHENRSEDPPGKFIHPITKSHSPERIDIIEVLNIMRYIYSSVGEAFFEFGEMPKPKANMDAKDTRWVQRFSNFIKVFAKLDQAVLKIRTEYKADAEGRIDSDAFSNQR